jgi:Ca2+-binding RTX toxin-like protein
VSSERAGGLALAVVAITAAVAALAGRSDAAPHVELASSGPIAISNSLEGHAILMVDDLAPGESRSAVVEIGNTGSAPGDLGLTGSQPVDQPGPNGGAMSPALVLEIADVTGGSDLPVYAGRLSDLESVDLPTLPPGDGRTYRFAVTLPDGGVPPTNWSGDNAFQASSTTVNYEWTLTGAGTSPCGNPLRGTAGADRLVGTQAGDRIDGEAGADLIRARGGEDCANGGGGADRLRGGSGADRLHAGNGRDRIRGGHGNDVVWTGATGVDVVRCGAGADTAHVGRRDIVHGCEDVSPGAGA